MLRLHLKPSKRKGKLMLKEIVQGLAIGAGIAILIVVGMLWILS